MPLFGAPPCRRRPWPLTSALHNAPFTKPPNCPPAAVNSAPWACKYMPVVATETRRRPGAVSSPSGTVSAVPVNRKFAFVVVPVAVTNSTPFMTLLLAPEIATHALPVHVCHSPRVELKQTDSPVVGLLICEHVARMNGPPD